VGKRAVLSFMINDLLFAEVALLCLLCGGGGDGGKGNF